jgi:hypothetical protein
MTHPTAAAGRIGDVLIDEQTGSVYRWDDILEMWIEEPKLRVSKAQLREHQRQKNLELAETPFSTDRMPSRKDVKQWVAWHKQQGLDPVTGGAAKSRGQLKREARKRLEEVRAYEREYNQTHRQQLPEGDED